MAINVEVAVPQQASRSSIGTSPCAMIGAPLTCVWLLNVHMLLGGAGGAGGAGGGRGGRGGCGVGPGPSSGTLPGWTSVQLVLGGLPVHCAMKGMAGSAPSYSCCPCGVSLHAYRTPSNGPVGDGVNVTVLPFATVAGTAAQDPFQESPERGWEGR